MEDKISIKVEFTEEVNGNKFTDSLYFTPEDYEALSEKQLNSLKKERVDNFKAFIDNPPEPIEPTKEELEQQKQMLQDQVAELDARIVKKLEVVEPIKGK